MSLLLGHSPKLLPVLVRASAGPSCFLLQTPPCFIVRTDPCGADHVEVNFASMAGFEFYKKKAPMELVNDPIIPWLAEQYDEDDKVSDAAATTIGCSHGWVASLMHGVGILRLQDDLNLLPSNSNPKRISLPPLVTVSHCQTQIITNVSLSSQSPDEEYCVVAVKFLGPQLSFCTPQINSEWFNIRIANPCFFSSRVMFSKKHNMFRLLGSGGQVIASWDLWKDKHTPKIQVLRYHNLPQLSEAESSVMDTTAHLVESISTGEMFLVKCFRQTTNVDGGVALLKTKGVMVFKLDDNGYAVYTRDIGGLNIFISESEPFCVYANHFPSLHPNQVYILDATEIVSFNLTDFSITTLTERAMVPFFFPPQDVEY